MRLGPINLHKNAISPVSAAHKVGPIFRGVPSASAASLSVAIVVAIVMNYYHPNYLPWLWLSTLFAAQSARAAIWWKYLISPQSATPETWLRRYVLGTLSIGIVWGSANIFLFDNASIEQQVFLAFVSAGITAGGVINLMYHVPAYLVFQLPILLPLIIQLSRQHTVLGWAMAATGSFYLLYTLVAMLRTNAMWRENIVAKTDAAHREALFLRMEKLAQVGAWRSNPTTGLFECTDQWRRILGIKPNDTASTDDLIACCEPPSREDLHHALIICEETGLPVDMAITFKIASGALKTAQVAAERRDHNGVYEITGILHDTTGITASERAKTEFISIVSHELRTPLTAIIGSLGMLELTLKKLATGRNDLEMLTLAQRNSTRLLNIVNDLLDFNKLEAGAMQMSPRAYSVGKLLRRAVTENYPIAQSAQIELHLQIMAEETLITVDNERFMQVMTNLISNAVKFSSPGQRVEVFTDLSDRSVDICVSDQGVGIPEAFRSSIFKPFAQADSSDTRKIGGTGLGLAVSKRLIESMGGQLRFTSREGEGTTFFISFPRND